MDSAYFIFRDLFRALKKQKVEQRTPNTATTRRAKVVCSPVSALVMDSSMPRNMTVLERLGALVPEGKTPRSSHSIGTDLNINGNLKFHL